MRTMRSGVVLVATLLALSGTGAVLADVASNARYGSGWGEDVSGMQMEHAMVRVMHASPDAPAVDVWIDGMPAFEGLAFGNASPYAKLPAGEHTFVVVASQPGMGGNATDAARDATWTGTAAGNETWTDTNVTGSAQTVTGLAIINTTVDLAAGMAYTVAAVGPLAQIQPLVLEDTQPASGMPAKVRVVHASPDAPAVDVAPAGGEPLAANLTFGDASERVSVPAGTYDLEVRLAGTTGVVLAVPGVELEGGRMYTVFAVGTLADGTLAATLVEDAKGHA